MNILNPFSKYKNLKKLRNKEPAWVSWFVGLLGILYFFGYFFLVLILKYALLYNLIFVSFVLLSHLLASLISSSLCLKFAEKNKGSPTLAFGVGFMSLIGPLTFLFYLYPYIQNLLNINIYSGLGIDLSKFYFVMYLQIVFISILEPFIGLLFYWLGQKWKMMKS